MDNMHNYFRKAELLSKKMKQTRELLQQVGRIWYNVHGRNESSGCEATFDWSMWDSGCKALYGGSRWRDAATQTFGECARTMRKRGGIMAYSCTIIQ